MNTALSEPFWLDCQHKGHRRGRLLVQAQYLNRIEAKPIRVLVLTWNLGNASPSPAFSGCFPDSEMYAPLTNVSRVMCPITLQYRARLFVAADAKLPSFAP